MGLSRPKAWTAAAASGAWVGLLVAERVAGTEAVLVEPRAVLMGLGAAAFVAGPLGLMLHRREGGWGAVLLAAVGALGMVLHGAFRIQAQVARGLVEGPAQGLQGEAHSQALAGLAQGPQLEGARNAMLAPLWWPITRTRACHELAVLELQVGAAALEVGDAAAGRAVLQACAARSCAPELSAQCTQRAGPTTSPAPVEAAP